MPSPRSGALRCRCACPADRRFSSREGEGNRPRGERWAFFWGLTRAADWAFRGGARLEWPRPVPSFSLFYVPVPVPSRLPAPPRLFPERQKLQAAPARGFPASPRYRGAPAGQAPTASPEDGSAGPLPLCRPAGSRAGGGRKGSPPWPRERWLQNPGAPGVQCSPRRLGRGGRAS